MKNKKIILIKKIVAVSTAVSVLMGCQLPAEKRNTRHIMHDTLQEAAIHSEIMNNQSSTSLPEDIKKAFMPNLVAAQGKENASVEKRFDLVAEQVPARTFFLSLVEGTPYNITVHPGVDGKISLQLKKVTIPEVLETVRNVYGYGFRQTTQGIEVSPAALQTRAFSVNYLDIKRSGQSNTQVSAGGINSGGGSGSGSGSGGGSGSGNSSSGGSSGSGNNSSSGGSTGGSSSGTSGSANSVISTTSQTDFWKELALAIEIIIGKGEGRTIAVSPMASLVVVQAMPDELKRVEEYLRSAEISLNKQVILEAKILEVELDDSFQAGINWNLISGRMGAASIGNGMIKDAFYPNATFPGGANGTSAVNVIPGQAGNNFSQIAGNSGSFGGVFALAANFKHLGAFMELLSAQGKVHVLSNPRVSTMNKQKALIKVGSDAYYVTGVTTTTTTPAAGATTSSPTVTFNSFFSGIALDVTPHITEKNDVTLHIHPTISSVDSDTKTISQQEYPMAKSNVRESDSMVKAKNGEMVIIGGLMQNQTSDKKVGLPILKDLPLLGFLFGHTIQVTRKSELVILLKPIVMEPVSQIEAMNNNIDRFDTINEEINRDENKYNCKDTHH